MYNMFFQHITFVNVVILFLSCVYIHVYIDIRISDLLFVCVYYMPLRTHVNQEN